MQQDLATIEKELMAGGINPHLAAEYKMKIAGWYSFISQQIEDILTRRPSMWNAIRETEGVKSAKQADRIYEASEDGIKLMKLKMLMDRMDNMKSALSSLLRVYENEVRNLH